MMGWKISSWVARMIGYSRFWRRPRNLQVELLSRAEDVTRRINRLARKLKHQRYAPALGQGEHCARLVEQVVSAAHAILSQPENTDAILTVIYLLDDCREHLRGLSRSMTSLRWGFALDVAPPTLSAARLRRNCYFCSRPGLSRPLWRVRLSLKDGAKSVKACWTCLTELRLTRKARVLHFFYNGREVHWSEVENYLPKQNYWTLNKPLRHLRLVVSRQSLPQP